MRTMTLLWLSAALALGTAGGAVAAEVDAPRQLTIGVEDLRYYPLHSSNNGSVFSGYARDVLDAFAKQQGYSFRYVPLPINRLYVAFLKERSVDFKYPDNPKWKASLRASLPLAYSTPLVVSEEGAMVLPAQLGRPLPQIKSLGTVLGFTPWPYQTAIESKALTPVVDDTLDVLLRLALAGRVDAVYANVDVANYLLAEKLHAPGGLVFDPSLPHARSDFSMSTIRYPGVVVEFDAFLRRETHLLRQLRSKYEIKGRAGP